MMMTSNDHTSNQILSSDTMLNKWLTTIVTSAQLLPAKVRLSYHGVGCYTNSDAGGGGGNNFERNKNRLYLRKTLKLQPTGFQ